MSIWQWFLVGALVLIVVVAIEAIIRRNRPRKSLAETFGASDKEDDSVPLGMEATDLDMLRQAEHANRVIESRDTRLK